MVARIGGGAGSWWWGSDEIQDEGEDRREPSMTRGSSCLNNGAHLVTPSMVVVSYPAMVTTGRSLVGPQDRQLGHWRWHISNDGFGGGGYTVARRPPGSPESTSGGPWLAWERRDKFSPVPCAAAQGGEPRCCCRRGRRSSVWSRLGSCGGYVVLACPGSAGGLGCRLRTRRTLPMVAGELVRWGERGGSDERERETALRLADSGTRKPDVWLHLLA